MDVRSQGSNGRRLSGTPVLIDAWESGLLRQDTVPLEIWEAAKARLLFLETEVAGLDEAKRNAEVERDQWMAFHKRATEKFEQAKQAHKKEADLQEEGIAEANKAKYELEQELEVAKQKADAMEEPLEVDMELSYLEDRPLDVQLDELRKLEEEDQARLREKKEISAELDTQMEATEKQIESLKAESASKDKELQLLYDSITSAQSRQENLDIREQQAEMDCDELDVRERALDSVSAKLNEEKLQACLDLHLAKPADLDLEIARLSGNDATSKLPKAIERDTSPVARQWEHV